MSIAAENRLPGTGSWWRGAHAPAGAIEGYPATPSVVAGDALSLCVSTRPACRYRIEVFRLGWYGGQGGRLMTTLPANVGLPRDAPLPDLQTGLVRAGWPVSDVVTTDESWTSGQYLAVLTLTQGSHADSAVRIPFVVRAPPGDMAPILVQMPVNTVQAYNHWGGKCLYPSNSTHEIAAVKVSFDRPVPCWEQANLNAKAPFQYELPLIRWIEREGFEVAYQTDVDTHREPFSLVGRRVFVSAGHDEYWTREMRDAVEAALRDATNLAFMGANTCYWQIRYEDAERTIVEYRDETLDPEPDPTLKTVRFRDLTPPRPERELIGQQYEGGIAAPLDSAPHAFVPAFGADVWARGIDLDPGRPLERLVGYEWDTYDDRHPPPGLIRILHAPVSPAPADCVRWRAASGATVFSAGSLQFAWALDDWVAPGTADARVQQFMRAGFRQMLAAP